MSQTQGFYTAQQRAPARAFVLQRSPSAQQQQQQPAAYAHPQQGYDPGMYQQQQQPPQQPPQNTFQQRVQQQQARPQQYAHPVQRQPTYAPPAGNRQPQYAQGYGQPQQGVNNVQRTPFSPQQYAGAPSQSYGAQRPPAGQSNGYGYSQPATPVSSITPAPAQAQRPHHGYSQSTPAVPLSSQLSYQRRPPISPSAIQASQAPSSIAQPQTPAPSQVPQTPQGRPLPAPRRADSLPPVAQPTSSFGTPMQRPPATVQNRHMFPPTQSQQRQMSISPIPMAAARSMPDPSHQMSRSSSPAPPPSSASPSRAGSRPLPVPTPSPSRAKHQSLDMSRLPSVNGLPKSSFDGIPRHPPSMSRAPSPGAPSGAPEASSSQMSRAASRSPSPTKASSNPVRPFPPALPPRQSPTKETSVPSVLSRFPKPPLPPRQSPTKTDTESSFRRRASPPKFDLTSTTPPPDKPGSPTKFVPLWKQRQRTFAPPPTSNGPSSQLSQSASQPSQAASQPSQFTSHPSQFASQLSQFPSPPSHPSSQASQSSSRSQFSHSSQLSSHTSQFSQQSQHARSPASSSRPLPAPRATSSYAQSERSASPMYSSEEDEEEDDEDEESEDLENEPPSPGYGIRDLPRTNSQAPPLEDYEYDYLVKQGSAPAIPERGRLPQPPGMPRSLPGSAFGSMPKPPEMTRMAASAATGDTASMTLRFAALGMDDAPQPQQPIIQEQQPITRTHQPVSRSQPPVSRTQPPTMQMQQPMVPVQQTMSQVQPVSHAQRSMMQMQASSSSRSRSSSPAKRAPREWEDLDDAPPPPARVLPQPHSPQITTHRPLAFRRTPPASSSTSAMKVESPSPRDGRNALPQINLPIEEDDERAPSTRVSPAINVEPPSISVNAPPSMSFSSPPSISVNAPSINVDPPSIAVSSVPGINVSGPAPPNPAMMPVIILGGEVGDEQPTPRKPHPKNLPPVIRKGGLACGGCGGAIIGRIVNAMGVRWHPGCFRCTVCDELLEHVSSYEKDGRPYCHLDYHENFAPRCYTCKTAIVEERFISLDDPALGKRNYHEQHFFCAECGDPFLTLSGGLPTTRVGELSVSGDGEFDSGEGVGFTVFRGHPYCENCHVRLRMPKCKRCKKSIRDHTPAVEALGGKWCYECFVCAGCDRPFEDPSFFQRDEQPYCEHCYMVLLRNDL